MKIENLIQIVQNLLDVNAVDFEFKVYDSLKMDNVQLDVNKVNGLARITTGSIDPILNLGQSSATMVVEFIYPYERLEAVRETLLSVSQNSAGLVVPNNTLDASLTGSTGVIISYPTQGNYFNGTMGETARSRLICYFDINEKSIMSNDIKLSIMNGYKEANTELKGHYYKYVENDYVKVDLPAEFEANTIYFEKHGNTYTEVNSTLTSSLANQYFTKAGETYTKVNLPTDYTANTIYYVINWEDIPYYKYIITRHRLSTTNKYNNNKEMQTVNDGQSIDFSLAVPSIKGSVINSIKNDMLTGDNIGKTFTFRVIEEDGADNPKYFENMIASGDFSYEIVPGNVLLFKILFVYKRM